MYRLSSDHHPLLTELVLMNLKKVSAMTVLDFLEMLPEDIVKHTGLPYGKISSIKGALLSKHAPKMTVASNWLKECQERGSSIKSAIRNLDQLLGGGFRTGLLYELCGGSPSGKSQICMAVSANILSSGKTVFYIDTKGDLSLKRIVSNFEGNVSTERTLSKLLICHPITPYDLITALHNFIEDNKKPQILVVDSLAAPFLQLIGDQHTCLALLSNVKSLLNYIAVEMHTPVLLTNVLTWQNDEGEDAVQFQKAALGKFWSHAPSTRINTSRLPNNNILLTVTKSSYLAIGTSTTVSVTETGVR